MPLMSNLVNNVGYLRLEAAIYSIFVERGSFLLASRTSRI